jgi:protein-disulfide isomerase-like protein with CxxC motif
LSTDEWMNHPDWSEVRIAAGIADSTHFDHCEESQEALQELHRDSVWTSKLKLSGTPTFAARTGAYIGTMTTATLGKLLSESPSPDHLLSASRK